jgi:hypothetical protein
VVLILQREDSPVPFCTKPTFSLDINPAGTVIVIASAPLSIMIAYLLSAFDIEKLDVTILLARLFWRAF